MELSSLKNKTFQKVTFQAPKIKEKNTLEKYHIFRKMELSSFKLKNIFCFLCFRRKFAKPEKSRRRLLI